MQTCHNSPSVKTRYFQQVEKAQKASRQGRQGLARRTPPSAVAFCAQLALSPTNTLVGSSWLRVQGRTGGWDPGSTVTLVIGVLGQVVEPIRYSRSLAQEASGPEEWNRAPAGGVTVSLCPPPKVFG